MTMLNDVGWSVCAPVKRAKIRLGGVWEKLLLGSHAPTLIQDQRTLDQANYWSNQFKWNMTWYWRS